jgi:hypothetical protein
MPQGRERMQAMFLRAPEHTPWAEAGATWFT